MSSASKLRTADIHYWLEGGDFTSLLDAMADPTNDDKWKRRAAAAVIRNGDIDVANQALQKLRVPNTSGRNELMQIAYKLHASQLVAFARDAVKTEPSHAVRATSATVLREAKVPSDEWVLDALRSDSPGARTGACIAIEEENLTGYCEPLKSLLNDENLDVRLGALLALGKTGCTESVDAVTNRFGSANKKELVLAAITSVELGSAEVALRRLDESKATRVNKSIGRWFIRRTAKKLTCASGS